MDRAEYESLLRAQSIYLEKIGPETRFTARTICDMHRDWLGDIYDWAGKYRDVELQKGDFRWPPAYLVAQNMASLEKGLLAEHTPCRPGALTNVARRMAIVHSELLLIHPFRDGNGRVARWLADLMAMQAGLPLPDYGFAGKGEKARQQEYLSAVRAGYVEEFDPLAAFFTEAIERRLRGARR
jgi:cell filamentation protein